MKKQQLTAEEWFKQLPAPYDQMALEELSTGNRYGNPKDTYASLSKALLGGFLWQKSSVQDGIEFWHAIWTDSLFLTK